MIFSTRDDCSTFVRSRPLRFSPDEIVFHPSSTDVVLSYDEKVSKVIHDKVNVEYIFIMTFKQFEYMTAIVSEIPCKNCGVCFKEAC